ncbi:lipase [Streptomyces sp. SAJ15]|nr:lipase [Streptomyces sp. SAJ15]
MRAIPFPHSLLSPLRSSTALVRATAVDVAVLAAHVLLYPTGFAQEHPPEDSAPSSSERAPKSPESQVHRPVLLLHGFIDNRSVFVLLRRSLRQHGRHHVEALNYSPLTCDIRTAAELLGKHVEEICARTGQRRLDLVGHSLGGLIARYYVQRLGGDARVHTLVTLGTPHSGTRAAPLLSAHPIVRQMRPDSTVIAELRLPAPGCRTRFVSFWSDMDQVMTPVETAQIDHPDLQAENVCVKGVGHLALPVHPAIATGVRQALDGSPIEPEAEEHPETEGRDEAGRKSTEPKSTRRDARSNPRSKKPPERTQDGPPDPPADASGTASVA